MEEVILQEYQVRKSNKEKTGFITYIKERLLDAGYDPETDITIEEKGKGLFKSRNIVVGNPAEADVIVGAHYDTCAVLPFPNFMAPTNPLLFALGQGLVVVILFAITFAITLLAALLTKNYLVSSLVFEIVLLLLLFHVLFGYRNKHTANDNTSGVIAITRLLENLPQEQRNKVCVVYFDNEEKGLFGSSFFYKKHKKEVKNKLLINLDCVGDGKTICSLAKRKARKDELYTTFLEIMEGCAKDHDVEFIHRKMKPLMFGSDQMHFDKGVGICALRKCFLGRYVARIHTPFDTKCREENIIFLADSMNRFVKEKLE